MKVKVTEKELKENYYYIISINYCNAYYLLKIQEPRYYTWGVYGWKSDNYHITNNILISTGYRPLNNHNLSKTNRKISEIVTRYEKTAEKIYLNHNFSWEQKEKKLSDLLEKFVVECIEKKEV